MTLTVTPTHPVAAEEVTITSDASAVLVTDYAIELTSVPSKSALTTGLLLTETDLTDEDVNDPIRAAELGILADGFTPDVPGEYGVKVYLIREMPNRAFELVRGIVTTDSGTVHVGAVLDLPIRTLGGEGAALRLQVNDATIRAASLVNHASELSRSAALQSAVTAALDALEGATVATAMGVFLDRVENLRAEYGDHIASSSWHATADAENKVERYQAHDLRTGIATLNNVRGRYVAHTTELTTGSRFHTADDTKNQPVTGPATTVGEANVLLSDLRERCFERHRVQGSGGTPAVHTTAGGDTTNALSEPTLFDNLVVAYLDALVEADPAAATGESDGAVDLGAHGFRVA